MIYEWDVYTWYVLLNNRISITSEEYSNTSCVSLLTDIPTLYYDLCHVRYLPTLVAMPTQLVVQEINDNHDDDYMKDAVKNVRDSV